MITSRLTWISKLAKSPLLRNVQTALPNAPRALPGPRIVSGFGDEELTEATKKKKKTTIIPKITLLQGNEISVVTLEEAQKLSKRRDLKLVKVIDLDTKTQRAVYKLMTKSEYHAEDIKQKERKKEERARNSIKGEKLLMLGHNIAEHDLDTNVKRVLKWIGRKYEVRIVINGDSSNMAKAEAAFKHIEKAIKDEGRIVQKRQKGNDIKFQIIPPKKPNDEENNNKNTD